jgi:hypothetical protein
LVAGRGCSELQSLPFPVHRLLTPSLVGRRASLAGLLLFLSSLHASDCTLLLHRLVFHPRLRGRLRRVSFGAWRKPHPTCVGPITTTLVGIIYLAGGVVAAAPMPFGLQGENLFAPSRRNG